MQDDDALLLSYFPIAKNYEFTKRMHELKIVRLERELNESRQRLKTLAAHGSYNLDILLEKNDIIRRQQMMIETLRFALYQSLEEIKNGI